MLCYKSQHLTIRKIQKDIIPTLSTPPYFTSVSIKIIH